MAYDIETYDPSATDSVSGITDGFGRPNVPPNYDPGVKQGPGVGYGQPLAWGSDLICDPADTDSDCDPAFGYSRPYDSARI